MITRTRAEAEARYPGLQERYLCFCVYCGIEPYVAQNQHFMAWVNRRASEYRAARGLKHDDPLDQNDFSAWLWKLAEERNRAALEAAEEEAC